MSKNKHIHQSKIGKFLTQELSGWTKSEVSFFAISCAAICIVSIIAGDTIMGLASSITGVIYTICNGKGKRISYIFGLVNSVLFAIISFQNTLYGDAVLYGLYYTPAMFVGFAMWSRNFDVQKLEIVRRKMGWQARFWLAIICIVTVVLIGYVLSFTDDALPYLDSFTTMTQVIATILAILRYYEQWFLWTVVNIAEILLWTLRTLQGAENAAVSLAMFTVFLVVGIKMWIDWHKKIPTDDN